MAAIYRRHSPASIDDFLVFIKTKKTETRTERDGISMPYEKQKAIC
jgi:hypothetical protein